LSTADLGTTNVHAYDGIHCIADLNEAGDVIRSYTYGPGIDNALAFTTYEFGETNSYYYLTDHLGSVFAITDEGGAIVERYAYDGWGRTTVSDGNGMPMDESALGNRIAFQGREIAWTTGLYNFRARWYDPITGRWLSQDPIRISGGLNQYVAFANNPVNFLDPYGLVIAYANHEVKGGFYHSKLIIIPNNQKYWRNHPLYGRHFRKQLPNGRCYTTLGAGPDNGNWLDSGIYRPRDVNQPFENWRDLKLPSRYGNEDDAIQELLGRQLNYEVFGNVPYVLFPEPGRNQFNSNSYIFSLLHYTDFNTGFSLGANSPGWGNVIPIEYFGGIRIP